jgi:TolB-like protein/Tfp pilus assembly protein PilF
LQLWFGDYSLDTDRRELRRGGELVALEPQVFDLLVYLVQNRDRVVSKDDLFQSVWGGRIVSESALTSRITAVRKAIGDDGGAQRLIRTVPRKGLRFIGEVHGEAAATPASPPAPRLSIVVLPFENLSNDPNQEYFADGITDDLTTDLSRISDMVVISRNTAFTYQGRRIDTKQIGRELGVRYVLEGSVRRSGSQIRINAQLIDAETNTHLWAERFDGDTSDLFALQDEITTRIAVALNRELIAREAGRGPEHSDLLDYIFRGRAAFSNPGSRVRYAKASSMFEEALVLDPRSVSAQSWLAAGLAARVMDNMTDTAEADMVRAEQLAERALAASPHTCLAHMAKGEVLRAQRRYLEAIPEFETVLALNRSWVRVLHSLGQCKLYTGSVEETIPLVEQAIRLSPRDPAIGYWYQLIGSVRQLQSRTDEAIIWLERARDAIPTHPNMRAQLASAYALDGQTERAAAELAEARRLSSDDRYTSLARLRAVVGYWGVPKIRALFEATLFVGLRLAGMPAE